MIHNCNRPIISILRILFLEQRCFLNSHCPCPGCRAGHSRPAAHTWSSFHICRLSMLRLPSASLLQIPPIRSWFLLFFYFDFSSMWIHIYIQKPTWHATWMFTLKLNMCQAEVFVCFLNLSLPHATLLLVLSLTFQLMALSFLQLQRPKPWNHHWLCSLYTTYAWSKGKLSELCFETIYRLSPFPSLSIARLLGKLIYLFICNFWPGLFQPFHPLSSVLKTQQSVPNTLWKYWPEHVILPEALTASDVTQRAKPRPLKGPRASVCSDALFLSNVISC